MRFLVLDLLGHQIVKLFASWLSLARRRKKVRDTGKVSSTLDIFDNRTGRQYNIPILNNAIDAKYLQAISADGDNHVKTRPVDGLRVLDPGFQSTAVTKSRITYVEGVMGTIQYRMYSIEDLFEYHDFEEVAHLLIWGALPSLERKLSLRNALNEGLKPPALVTETIGRFPADAPPFSMVLAGLAAYAASDPNSIPTAANRPGMYQGDDVGVIDEALVRTISSMAAIVALVYCRQRNRVISAPDPQASFVCNVLLMMGFVDDETNKPKRTVVESLERLWILYCDHEMTNSTAAFLHVASTLADPISCCSAYVASGNGPLHAGAVDLAYKALVQLGTPDKVPGMIADVKAKKYRLFGYGHRIYRTVDPRNKFIKAMLKESEEHGRQNPLLAVALEIDRIASTDPYFTLRNLQANADLYGSFVYMALGFEPDIVAAMMMLSRMPGVMAHWRETRVEQRCPLWRPQQVYIGCDAQNISASKDY